MFTDVRFGRPLPVRDEIDAAESGNGYALRMVVANHLLFSDLTRALASIGHRYLPNSTAKKIAYWFGANPVSVSRAIPTSYKLNGRMVSRFLDQEFSRPYHIRLSRPQVCVKCLDEFGYASAVWDISLITCCVRHKVQLIDRCLKCARVISWRRPDLWTCHCRADFRLMETSSADFSSLWLSSQLEHLILSAARPATENGLSLRILSMLGTDVLLRVIRALGISESESSDDIVPGRLTRVLTSIEAQEVVGRAFLRMSQILAATSRDADVPALHVKELCDLRADVVRRDEIALGHILNAISTRDGQYAVLKPVTSQLSLL